MMFLLFYPQASDVNGEGELKVVFAVVYNMINTLLLNGNYLVCRRDKGE